ERIRRLGDPVRTRRTPLSNLARPDEQRTRRSAERDRLRLRRGAARMARTTARRWVRGLCGLLAGAVGLSIGRLIAAFVGPASAPLVAVGSAIVDILPDGLERTAIRLLGEYDKTVLFIAMGIVIACLLVVAGLVE